MVNELPGTMRCPIGAIARWDEASQGFTVEPDGFVSEEDRKIVRSHSSDENDFVRRIGLMAKGRVRCPASGPVSVHSKDKTLIVVLCPVHGAVEARADIWKKEVK